MRGLNKLIERVFRFDKSYDEYELPERERGAPSGLFGWREHPHGNDTGQGSRNNIRSGQTAIPASPDDIEKLIGDRLNAGINSDPVIRRFCICGAKEALLVYVSGMADEAKINRFILEPLMEAERTRLPETAFDRANEGSLLKKLEKRVIRIGETKLESNIDKVLSDVMDGMTALFVEDGENCLLMETRGYEKRAISSSENEKTVLGPKESFTESLKTNITLLRRTVRREELVVETQDSGDSNRTKLALIYLKGITDASLVGEIKKRLSQIEGGTLTDSGMLQQLIESKRILPVPQMLVTERPDRVCSHVMQGCVCIMLEGSPNALVLPITLFSLLNSPEDVYMRRPIGTLQRLVRYAGTIISILLPGYFLSLAMYHQGGLTAEVLSTVASSRKMVFEPIAVEMILLLLVFQLIREAGLRVPGAIGQAIGIIGGLIMGQAAVAANLASSVVLIIVALSGLGNFCIADYSMQIAASYFRIAVVVAAWLGGLVAIVSAVMLFTAMLAGTKSFGVPFLSPYAPKTYAKRPPAVRGELGMHRRGEDYLNTSADAE